MFCDYIDSFDTDYAWYKTDKNVEKEYREVGVVKFASLFLGYFVIKRLHNIRG